MRLASESAEEEETQLSRRRGRDRARRTAQSSQATKNCRGDETADARERRDRDGTKRHLDSDSAEEKEKRLSSETLSKQHIVNSAIIHVSSCNDVLALQKMSLATFHIELGLHSKCMSRLHTLYFTLRTSYSMCMYLRQPACPSGRVYSYIHLMSITQLDRSRSPAMPCILLVYIIYIHKDS